ncbi:MAG: hypothetical protein Q9190_007912 [Brigantiaea leucoxantha]
MKQAVGGIESAIGQAQGQAGGVNPGAASQHLDTVEEEPETSLWEATPTPGWTAGSPHEHAASVATSEESYSRSTGSSNQPSHLRRSGSVMVAESAVSAPFAWNWKHFVVLLAATWLLAMAFADIYRGPIFGPEYDLLRWRSGRVEPSNQSVSELPAEFEHLTNRINVLEQQVRKASAPTPKQRKPIQVNYFSPSIGAVINPRLTSPEMVVEGDCSTSMPPNTRLVAWPAWWNIFSSKKHCKFGMAQSDPVMALAPWDDFYGPNWCAPVGRDSATKLQLQVMLPVPVSPTELIIEHNPREAELFRVAAPREVELWIEVANERERMTVGNEFMKLFPDKNEWHPSNHLKSLPGDYVSVGRWEYDYHSPDFVQHFKIPVDLTGISAHNIAVRITSTWEDNSPATCLYRLRLHGAAGPVPWYIQEKLRHDLPRA